MTDNESEFNMKKKTLKTLIVYIVFTVVLLYLLMLSIDMLMTLAKYKVDITGDLILDSLIQTALHPIQFVRSSIDEKNPLMVAGSLAIVGYMIFLFVKATQKQKSWQVDKNDTHGSADWLQKQDLVKDGDYQLVNQNDFYSEWKKSFFRK